MQKVTGKIHRGIIPLLPGLEAEFQCLVIIFTKSEVKMK